MPRYIRKYINFLLFFAIINSPLSVLGTFFDARDFTTYFILIAWLIADAFIICINFKFIRFNKWELILFLLLIMSTIVGVFHNYALFDRRIITDISNPLFFLLKAIIFRQAIKSKDFEEYFSTAFIKKLITYTFLSGIVTVVLYYILSSIRPMYVGLTPMSHPAFIFGLLKGNYYYLVGALSIIVLAGKRALLVSSIIILVVYRLRVQKKLLNNLALLSFVAIVGLIVFKYSSNADSVAAFGKYMWTYETIRDSEIKFSLDDETGVLDLITGGRMGEVNGALKEMHPLDYIFGKGVGFTYTFSSPAYEDKIENYSNLHFTPLSIITKYGIPFFIFFLIYFYYCLKGFKRNGALGIFLGLYVIGVCIDMLFAYVIFVDPILPIALGYLSFKRK